MTRSDGEQRDGTRTDWIRSLNCDPAWDLIGITAEELDFRLLMTGDMLSPLLGNEEIDPQSDSFSQWLMNLQYDE